MRKRHHEFGKLPQKPLEVRTLYKVLDTQIYIILNSGKLNPKINGTSFETKNKIYLIYIIVMISVNLAR